MTVRRPPLERWHQATADLAKADADHADARRRRTLAVRDLRQRGMSWVKIGQLVDLTPQRVQAIAEHGNDTTS